MLCIRDVPTDENNPWSAYEIMKMLSRELFDLLNEGKVILMIIPDIESINFGRGVGYDVIEHVPPQEIHDISATKIREKMKNDSRT
jgi:nicotinamide mononucleotide adenylyltransferase